MFNEIASGKPKHELETYAIDLDGTLAHYDHYRGNGIIGKPIPLMVEKVKEWLSNGISIKILTARASTSNKNRDTEIEAIKKWCIEVFGKEFPVTAEKDFHITKIYDDRAYHVKKNTGMIIGDD